MPRFPETDAITSKLPFYMGGIIASWTHCAVASPVAAVTTATNWPGANRAIYVPVIIPERVTITHLGWYNGTTAADNADAGIYSEDSTLIISTTPTAQSGTSQWQTVNITDTPVGPGLFYLALSLSGTSRLAYLAAGATQIQVLGVAQQASAGTLPASATMAVAAATTMPLIIALTDTTA